VPSCDYVAQVLVFVHSRKETAKTASFIKDTALKEEKLAKFIKQDR
jgi:pre-mRNA-splicing helicase BRR2